MDQNPPSLKIRSITCFLHPRWPLDEQLLDQAGAFVHTAQQAFETGGYEVQTVRLATIPFPRLLRSHPGSRMVNFTDEAIYLARALEAAALARGFGYVSIGPALPGAMRSYAVIPEVLAATTSVFLSGMMTTPRGGVSLPAVQACGAVIHQNAGISPDGFANLRFAALANVRPGSPFFPAAYHAPGRPAFALATESAALAVEACTRAGSLDEARRNLIEAVQSHAERLTVIARSLESEHNLRFGGIDFSLAPFPEQARSLGAALEGLGLTAVGQAGSLASAAFLADTLDRARFLRTGFSGLFLPVLEDAVLAARAAEGSLTIRDLLLYSAVCGAGLDTVPLPGDISSEELSAILLDVAVLAQRLQKPLTARLMPIPGKVTGDPTNFDFAFFANSRVMPHHAAPLHANLAGSEVFYLRRRQGS